MTELKVMLAGVDEVGRGPLAGDVVAAAVILGDRHGIEGLTDSKKLSEKKREYFFELIQEKALAFCIARADVSEIDSLNILQASLLAMKRAVEGLHVQPQFVKVDGNKLPAWTYASEAIVKGDSLVEEISAASILAKVTRDRELDALDLLYPGYGLARHKGYPTKEHLVALEKLGPSAIHRRSFGPVKKPFVASGIKTAEFLSELRYKVRMDTEKLDASDMEQDHSEAVRRFIRHPANFPISYSLGAQRENQRTMRDVSCGGLCFTSETPIARGETVQISIPVEPPGFQAEGIVVWCRPEEDHFAIGVEFDGDSTSFSLRMVEQVCHIEHYRAEVLRCEGRELSREEAAEEWVAKYASSFPRH